MYRRENSSFKRSCSSINFSKKQVTYPVGTVQLLGLPTAPVPDTFSRHTTGKESAADEGKGKERTKDSLRSELVKQLEPEYNLTMWKHKMVEDENVTVGDVLCNEDSIYMEEDQQVNFGFIELTKSRYFTHLPFQSPKERVLGEIFSIQNKFSTIIYGKICLLFSPTTIPIFR